MTTADATTTAIVRTEDSSIARRERAPLAYTSEQEKIILDSYLSGATPSEAQMLIEGAKRRGLDIFKRQIFFVKRWDSQKKTDVWAFQTSIDGYRALAEATGMYDGQDEPEFEYNADGKLVAARVKVYRKDISRPFVGVARYEEYVQTTREGGPNSMWRKMPHTMLAKCAESMALRKAFPEDLGDIHTDAEAPEDRQQEVQALPMPAKQEPKVETDFAVLIEAADDLAALEDIKNKMLNELPNGGKRKALGSMWTKRQQQIIEAAKANANPQTGEVLEPGANG